MEEKTVGIIFSNIIFGGRGLNKEETDRACIPVKIFIRQSIGPGQRKKIRGWRKKSFTIEGFTTKTAKDKFKKNPRAQLLLLGLPLVAGKTEKGQSYYQVTVTIGSPE